MLCISIYLAAYLAICGTPSSVSETYYNTRPWLLPTVLIITIGTAVVPMFDFTPENFQFLVFLIIGGILFVAGAPAFKESLEGKVHSVAAIIAGIAATAWLAVMNANWTVLIAFALIALFQKKYRIFLLEVGFAASIYWQLMLMSFENSIS